jgi:hypothetical protein
MMKFVWLLDATAASQRLTVDGRHPGLLQATGKPEDTQTAEDIEVLARDPNAIEFLKPPAMATPTPGVPTRVATPSDVRVRGMQPS